MSTPEGFTFIEKFSTIQEIEANYGQEIASMYKTAIMLGIQIGQQGIMVGNQLAVNAIDKGSEITHRGIKQGVDSANYRA